MLRSGTLERELLLDASESLVDLRLEAYYPGLIPSTAHGLIVTLSMSPAIDRLWPQQPENLRRLRRLRKFWGGPLALTRKPMSQERRIQHHGGCHHAKHRDAHAASRR